MSDNYNRLANSGNRFQGAYKKVLCVCSAGLLRSPTAAVVLSQAPFNFNTRAAGVHADYALVVVDEVLVDWADEIVCMSQAQADMIKVAFPTPKSIYVLDIADSFEYRNPKLMQMIAEKYTALSSIKQQD